MKSKRTIDKILINAINLRSAGGLTVGLNFVQTLVSKHSEIKIILLAPSNCGYEVFEKDDLRIAYVPKHFKNFILRPFLEYFWIKKILKNEKPDVIFSMGNFALKTSIKQGVLVMNPFIIYKKEKEVWSLLSPYYYFYELLVRFYFRSRIKYASVVFSQTEVAKKHLANNYEQIKKITIVPMAYSNINLISKEIPSERFFIKHPENVYFLCLSKYYIHKNIEILVKVAELIKTQKINYRFIITLDKKNNIKKALDLLREIEVRGLTEIIINIGNVEVGDVPHLYTKIDGLILPTLFESFSATYIDSLHYKKPIFTSDRDFAIGVCHDFAFYFDPHSEESILSCIENAFSDKNKISEKIEGGFKLSNEYPNWDVVTEMFMSELDALIHFENN